MGYLIAYLLLALVFDLLRELVNPEGDYRNADAIHRRLWSDTHFDCRTRVFSVASNGCRQSVRTPALQNRSGLKESRACFARACAKVHGVFLTVPLRRRA